MLIWVGSLCLFGSILLGICPNTLFLEHATLIDVFDNEEPQFRGQNSQIFWTEWTNMPPSSSTFPNTQNPSARIHSWSPYATVSCHEWSFSQNPSLSFRHCHHSTTNIQWEVTSKAMTFLEWGVVQAKCSCFSFSWKSFLKFMKTQMLLYLGTDTISNFGMQEKNTPD